MHRTRCSTIGIIFITIGSISTKPMHLNGKLDTELKLGTSTLETITIPKLDISDSLDLTLATPSGPSELTTKNLGSPRNSRSSDVLGIQKTDLFKHRFQQKQSFRIIPDGMTSLEDQNVQTKPVSVSNLLEIYPNSIPHKDLIFTAFPFGFSTHPPLQGSFSRNLHIHEDSSHMLSGFPGSHSVQGFPAYDSSGKTFTKSVEDQHHPTIELPTYKTQYVDISPENPKGSTGRNGESEKLHSSKGKAKELVDPIINLDHHKSYITVRERMARWTNLGKEELWKQIGLREEMIGWFKILKEILIKRIQETKVNGMKSYDIEKAINRAQNKLTTTFLGYLVAEDHQLEGKSHEEILREGWAYMKAYMLQWRYANLALVLRSKDVTADGSVWEWTSDEVLGYLMWMLPSNVVSFKVFSRFISGWQDSNRL